MCSLFSGLVIGTDLLHLHKLDEIPAGVVENGHVRRPSFSKEF